MTKQSDNTNYSIGLGRCMTALISTDYAHNISQPMVYVNGIIYTDCNWFRHKVFDE